MKVTIPAKEFHSALSVAASVAPTSENAMAALRHLLLEAAGDELRITATDLGRCVTVSVPADVEDEGRVLAPAKRLPAIVQRAPGPDVRLRLDGKGHLEAMSGRASRTKLLALPADEFPTPPVVPTEGRIEVPGLLLVEMLRRQSHAMCDNEARYNLCGALVTMTLGELKIETTDGHKLSREVRTVEGLPEHEPFTLERGGVEVVLRAIDEGPAELAIVDNWVHVEQGHVRISTVMPAGTFPDFEHAIPKRTTSTLRCSREDLIAVAQRVGLMSKDKKHACLLTLLDDGARLSMQDPETGESADEVPGEVVHRDGRIESVALNPRYLVEVLRSIEGPHVVVDIKDPLEPVKLTDPDDPAHTRIIMPMRP